MAIFSTNQNRQLYVAKKYGTVNDTAEVGTIELKTIGTGNNKEMYFLYKGADTVLKSDRIPVNNLEYVKAVGKEALRTPFKSQIVTLSTDINEGQPVSGQDYILRITLRQWYGMSDQDVYFKEGAVHAVKGMTADQFYQKMVDSLNLCFSREVGATKDANPYLKFEVATESVKIGDETKSVKGIKITEKAQPWTLGTETQEPVLFDALATTIYVDGTDLVWGNTYNTTVAKEDVVVGTSGLGNGTKIADLEYFCMGERGDQYRMIGFPNYIPTTYLVDPTKEYNVLEVHCSFTDTGVNSYKSEKDVTVVAEDYSVINSIVEDLNTVIPWDVETLTGE